jgi:biotin carboxyl carrier protein
MEGKQEGGLPLVAATYAVTIDANTFTVVLISDREIEANGVRHVIDFVRLDELAFSLILDGKTYVAERITPQSSKVNHFDMNGERKHAETVIVNGTRFAVQIDDQRSLLLKSLHKSAQNAGGILIIRAPMPGMISRIEIQVGDEVASGQGLLVLEAMKMENEIRSLTRGRIQSIHVDRGRPVEKGEALVTVEEL